MGGSNRAVSDTGGGPTVSGGSAPDYRTVESLRRLSGAPTVSGTSGRLWLPLQPATTRPNGDTATEGQNSLR